jgi:acyl-CoA synthetase (AMP-forming)/AMP-acid ligase II
MTTPVDTILGWLDDPRQSAGIHFAATREDWDWWSYERIATRVREIAAGLQAHGALPGHPVLVVSKSGPEFAATLFGVMLAGAVPAPVAPPGVFADVGAYMDHLTKIAAVAAPSLIAVEGPPEEWLRELALTTTRRAPADITSFDAGATPTATAPADLALLQFTSGSTSAPRGVKVPFPALAANIAAIRSWLGVTRATSSAHWIPFHHDMGLIGGLITPVAYQTAETWSMQPHHFLRDPLRYLRCFDGTRTSIGTMPSFALEYVVRRVRPERLEGCDFSGWESVVIGAERINAQALDRFHRLLEPFGFRRTTLRPAYGLAEATLAVTGLPRGHAPESVTIDPERLTIGDPVVRAEDAAGQPVVGCGPPLENVTVEILGEDGTALPELRLGEIAVRGGGVTDGYVSDDRAAPSTAFAANALHTGDMGFLSGGQLFAIGRLGDSIKVRGRSVFAEDLEAALADAGILRSPAVVLLGVHGEPTAVAVLHRSDRAHADAVLDALKARAEGAKALVMIAQDGGVERTTSGKPKRRRMWTRFVAGDFPGEVAGRFTPDATETETADAVAARR